jgi:hypothetical protein
MNEGVKILGDTDTITQIFVPREIGPLVWSDGAIRPYPAQTDSLKRILGITLPISSMPVLDRVFERPKMAVVSGGKVCRVSAKGRGIMLPRTEVAANPVFKFSDISRCAFVFAGKHGMKRRNGVSQLHGVLFGAGRLQVAGSILAKIEEIRETCGHVCVIYRTEPGCLPADDQGCPKGSSRPVRPAVVGAVVFVEVTIFGY